MILLLCFSSIQGNALKDAGRVDEAMTCYQVWVKLPRASIETNKKCNQAIFSVIAPKFHTLELEATID